MTRDDPTLDDGSIDADRHPPGGSDNRETGVNSAALGPNAPTPGADPAGTGVGQTDTGRRLRAPPLSVDRLLQHPFVGIDPRRSAIAIALLGTLVAIHLVSVLAAFEIAGVRAQTLTPAFDSFSAFVIVASLLAVTVGPLAYACWNGGPGLAAVIPLVPVLVGDAVTFRWVLDVDVTVAITAAGAGAALALVAGEARTLGTVTPWRERLPPANIGLFVAVVCVASAGVVASFVLQAPDGMVAAYRSFVVYWLVPVAVAGCYLRAVW